MIIGVGRTDRSDHFPKVFEGDPAVGIVGNIAPLGVCPSKGSEAVTGKSNLGGLVNQVVKLPSFRDRPGGRKGAGLAFD